MATLSRKSGEVSIEYLLVVCVSSVIVIDLKEVPVLLSINPSALCIDLTILAALISDAVLPSNSS